MMDLTTPVLLKWSDEADVDEILQQYMKNEFRKPLEKAGAPVVSEVIANIVSSYKKYYDEYTETFLDCQEQDGEICEEALKQMTPINLDVICCVVGNKYMAKLVLFALQETARVNLFQINERLIKESQQHQKCYLEKHKKLWKIISTQIRSAKADKSHT